jgi:hypothetical protein
MSKFLNQEGYRQAKANLAALEARIERLKLREDLTPVQKDEVMRSDEDMRRLYQRNIKLYEEMREVTGGVEATL